MERIVTITYKYADSTGTLNDTFGWWLEKIINHIMLLLLRLPQSAGFLH